MSDIEEKRVFSEKTDRAVAYVASAVGVVRVTVSGAQVGRFGVVHRCTAAGVACDDVGGGAAVAADDDAYRAADDGRGGGNGGDGPEFRPTGFGPATAVGFADGTLLGGKGEDDGGRVARYDAAAGEWETAGETGGVRAIDGGAVAAADGVYLVGDGLRRVGLSDVRDVAEGGGVPFAATGDGLYRLGNGWMDELAGGFRTVAVAADGERVHAVSDDGEVFARGEGRAEDDGDGDAEWTRLDLPTDGRVADVAHTSATTLAVTESGTLLAEREDDWRAQALGLRGVTGLAVRG